MTCTFKQFLNEHYKLIKIKNLTSLKTSGGIGGVNWSDYDGDNDGDVGSEDEEEHKKTVDLNKHKDYNNSLDHNNQDAEHHPDKETDEKEEHKDPDKQGLIRKIKGAHLISKRVNEDGTYDELWMYRISRGNKNEYDIRSEILSNTDIEQKSGVSESGTQKYVLWTNNGTQFIQITGLPN